MISRSLNGCFLKYLFGLCISSFFTAAGLQAAETITATNDFWPPYVFSTSKAGGSDLYGEMNSEGRKVGLSVDIIRKAYQVVGYELDVSLSPWARAINEVRSGNKDVLMATWYEKDRAKSLLYSNAYLGTSLKLVKRYDDDFECKGIDSLDGKKIGVIRGYSYSKEFSSARNFSRDSGVTILANIRKLLSGRVDLVVGDERAIRARLLLDEPILLTKIAYCKEPLSTKKLYITSGLNNENSERYIAAFNRGLEIIKNNGIYEGILQRYRTH